LQEVVEVALGEEVVEEVVVLPTAQAFLLMQKIML
jgi:hypothetical protein